MKFIYLLILIVAIFGSCNRTSSVTDLERHSLKGKVKSIKRNTSPATEHFGKPVISATREREVYLFNERGNIVEITSYNEKGWVVGRTIFQYDDNNQYMGRKGYENEDGSLSWTTKVKLDEKGEIVEEKWYSPEGMLIMQVEMNYDNSKKEIEYLMNDYEDSSISIRTVKYDDDGKSVEDQIDRDIITFKYELFDKKGNWKRRIEYKNKKLYQVIEREFEYYRDK